MVFVRHAPTSRLRDSQKVAENMVLKLACYEPICWKAGKSVRILD
jgi:hypothetical protein